MLSADIGLAVNGKTKETKKKYMLSTSQDMKQIESQIMTNNSTFDVA